MRLLVPSPRLPDRPDRLSFHVAKEEFASITYREAIGIRDECPPLMSHEAGRDEAKRSEALQVVRVPGQLDASAKKGLTFLHEHWKIADIHDPHIETVRIATVSLVTVRGDASAEQLAVIGLDEDCRLQSIASRQRRFLETPVLKRV